MSYPENISSPPVDARVACVDGGASPTTNKACPEPTSKLDDHGRGGFSIEIGGFYVDRKGRNRGPVKANEGATIWPYLVADIHGVDTFTEKGRWTDDENSEDEDLIAPWIDWKAECEKASKALQRMLDQFDRDECVDFTNDADTNAIMAARAALARLASLKGEGAGA